jgi:uncharacterized protein (DUF927 family)
MNNDINAQNGYSGNYTDFPNQTITLKCDKYECNKKINLNDGKNIFYFPHPITITKIYHSLNTKKEKVEIAFRVRGKWKHVTVDKEVIATSRKIISLSSDGVAVTEFNAKGLVQYLYCLQILNESKIPYINTIKKFGYIKENGFVPYCDDIEFPKLNETERIFESVQQQGTYSEWLNEILPLMKYSKILNTVICSSFASILLKPINNTKPFFVHLWSGKSGNGKTSASYFASSVWGNHQLYTTSFKASPLGMDACAGIFNELPLIVDELQLLNNENNEKKFNPYLLTSGESKMCSNIYFGIQGTYFWNNIIITSGETPLTSIGGGAGEHNRIIEIEVKEKNEIFENEQTINNALKFINTHYGHAGKKFVEWLYSNEENVKIAENYVETYTKKLIELGITGKQSRSGAFILTANNILVNFSFFNDNETDIFDYSALLLTPEWLAEHLKTEKQVDITTRAYDIICNWISLNNNKFIHRYIGIDDETGIKKETYPNVKGDLYGEYDITDPNNIVVYINKLIFDKICKENKFDSRSILSELKRKNLIKYSENRLTISKRIDNIPTRVVCLYVK